MSPASPSTVPGAHACPSAAATLVELRQHEGYPHDDLGFLQRMHPLRGKPFGRLVYMADSVMQPMNRPGFGMHPHVNLEVISYVLGGELTHRDSAGNVGRVPAGGLQCITAGTGIEHDESNRTDKPLRMFQVWFAPDAMNVAPRYATLDAETCLRNGEFVEVVRPRGAGSAPGLPGPEAALAVNADASMSLGRFSAGQQAVVQATAGRATLLYVVEGSASLGNAALRRQDQLRLTGPQVLGLLVEADSLLMLIESAAAAIDRDPRELALCR
jgi:redox-sensitive bicupin YhaK (pirin superfamily)